MMFTPSIVSISYTVSLLLSNTVDAWRLGPGMVASGSDGTAHLLPAISFTMSVRGYGMYSSPARGTPRSFFSAIIVLILIRFFFSRATASHAPHFSFPVGEILYRLSEVRLSTPHVEHR